MYIISDVDTWSPSFGIVRIPNKTHGKWYVQSELVPSVLPLAFYTSVQACHWLEDGKLWTIIRIHTGLLCQMCSGIPNREIHELRRVDAHDVAVLLSICVASGRRIERSVTVYK